MTLRIGILSILLLLAVGCAGPIAKGPKYTPHKTLSKSEAIIYVYRPEANDGTTVCLKLLIHDQEEGCLNNLGFLKVRLNPGTYTITLQANAFMEPKILEFTEAFEGGKAYYFEYYFSNQGGRPPTEAVATKYIPILSGYHILLPKSENAAQSDLSILSESI
ncbi:DUF2846 domain-containing protein [Microbulbifer sp. TRSA005]|uniref:DUF2846 domain-containing protein n=1 Tax=Microbulbifer sp. TRSA005 TaxID=3243383 RepID=UPI00403A777F